MKTKKPKKEENNSSAFSHLIEQVEKEKKKARIMYSVGIVVLVLSLLSFLLFSPFEVPAFSQLGDRILGTEEEGIEEEEAQKAQKEEELEKEEAPNKEEVQEEEEVVVEQKLQPTPEPSTQPTPTPAPEPTPVPEPEPLYSCNQSTIDYYFQQYCEYYWKWSSALSPPYPLEVNFDDVDKWREKVDYYKDELVVTCGVPYTNPSFEEYNQACDARL